MRVVNPVFPPPGLDLQVPADLTPEKFCKQIGGDCHEYADKFETIDEVFKSDSVSLNHSLTELIERDESQGRSSSTEEVHPPLQRAPPSWPAYVRVPEQENLLGEGARQVKSVGFYLIIHAC